MIGLAPERELWRRSRSGDGRARDELIARHLPLAWKLARRHARGTPLLEDLLQVASLGLVGAVDRFDPGVGATFIGFATPTIEGELKKHFRDRVWMVRVPRRLHDHLVSLRRIDRDLRAERGRSASTAELAERSGLDRAEVAEALVAGLGRRTASLDAPVFAADGERLSSHDRVGGLDRGYERIDGEEFMRSALAVLEPEERAAVELRFHEDLSQARIAARLGCSQMHVSRLLARALERIGREHVGDGADGFAATRQTINR
jgi:RNA polymerase sigma-B factor